MQRSDTIADLATALAAAQVTMKNPTHDSSNPHFRVRYASLAAVRDAVIPPLAAAGIAVTQLVTTGEGYLDCETVLWHTSGEWLSSVLRLPVAQMTPQGYGAAITYARRFALMAICTVAGDVDDDGESTRRPEQERRPGERAPQQRREESPPVVSAAEIDERIARIEAITALHLSQGHDEDWVQRYWKKMQGRFRVVTVEDLPRDTLQALYTEAQEFYAKDVAVAPPLPPQRPTPPPPVIWRDIIGAHGADGRLSDELRSACAAVTEHTPDSEGFALADRVLTHLDALDPIEDEDLPF